LTENLISPAPTKAESRAKRRGVKLGRPPKLTPEQRREAIRRREEGARAEIARQYNVHPSTISRLTKFKVS
jgi:DNA invertase Pin-like site-specific DNA recombinase